MSNETTLLLLDMAAKAAILAASPFLVYLFAKLVGAGWYSGKNYIQKDEDKKNV